jgi:hypothetical protein
MPWRYSNPGLRHSNLRKLNLDSNNNTQDITIFWGRLKNWTEKNQPYPVRNLQVNLKFISELTLGNRH